MSAPGGLAGHPANVAQKAVDQDKGKPTGLLAVTIIQAKGLEHESFLTSFDKTEPYAVLSLNERPKDPASVAERDLRGDMDEIDLQHLSSQRTANHRGMNPIWNEKIYFVIYGKVDKVFVDIFDTEIVGASTLGTATLDLSKESLSEEWIRDMTIPLKNAKGEERSNANVHLLVHFEPVGVLQYLSKKLEKAYIGIQANVTKSIIKKALDTTNQSAEAYVQSTEKKAAVYDV
ncbi:hypothetical protein HK104_002270 [Borealophlyctis nickersoniae]|nr:hypothetical protein HK104_002270 [Borealophlyctis nickersoniae]